MNPENTNNPNDRSFKPSPAPQPIQYTTQLEPMSNPLTTPSPTPVITQPPQSNSDYKKIKILAIALIALAAASFMLTFISQLQPTDQNYFSQTNFVQSVFVLLQIVLGFGLLFHKKLAYHAYNIIAILSVLGGILAVSTSVYVFSTLSFIDVSSLIYNIIATGFWIYGLVILHPKRVRDYFK
jgi:hypothetical protein